MAGKKKREKEYPCTECGGDATFAYSGPGWKGLVKSGERLCIKCGRKRGLHKQLFEIIKPSKR